MPFKKFIFKSSFSNLLKMKIPPSLNRVLLMGQVENSPQIQGSADHPEMTFVLKTETDLEEHGLKSYKIRHRISILKPDIIEKAKKSVKSG